MARTCQRCGQSNSEEAKFCLYCGAMLETAAAASADPLIGRVLLGRYRVLSVLGEGGMGKVYLAEQKMGTAIRKVAIKTLQRELTNDPQIIARFHRECETVIELSHPNTIDFHDFGELEDGTLFIVMEYIEGESLAALLRRGPIETARLDRILAQMCGSLAEAHQRGIVHRDLKPENVLLTQRGGQTDFVKVLDFGIAKRNEAEDEGKSKLTKQGMVLGTPPYMSPEQFSGQTLDARSDIYSLGVMTYEMLVGRLPFDANTPWEWATQHLTAQPRPLDAFPAGAALPPNRSSAVMRALAKNREMRQASVIAFLQEFTGLASADAAWTLGASASSSAARPATGQSPRPSASGSSGVATPSGIQPRLPLATPGVMPSAASGALPRGPGGDMGTGPTTPLHLAGVSLAGAPTPGAGWSSEGAAWSSEGGAMPPAAPTPSTAGPAVPGGFPSIAGAGAGGASMDAEPVVLPGGGGAGRVVAVLGVVVLLIGGAAGGGWYYWMHRPRPPVTIANPSPGPGPMGSLPPPVQQGNGTANPPQPPTSYNTEPPKPPVTAVRSTPWPAADAGAQAPAPPPGVPDAGPVEPDGPDPARLADARDEARKGIGFVNDNDYERGARALQTAERLLGRRGGGVTRPLRQALSDRGSNQIGIFIQRDRCPDAQRLYQILNSVGAATRSARDQFGDWCRLPR